MCVIRDHPPNAPALGSGDAVGVVVGVDPSRSPVAGMDWYCFMALVEAYTEISKLIKQHTVL